MILDARLANVIAKQCPHVQLLTVEGLGQVEIEFPTDLPKELEAEHLNNLRVHVGISDVKGCLHRSKLPAGKCVYECLDLEVVAHDIG